MTDALIVLCTCPETAAEELASGLVQKRHAACVNILPPIRSIYHWDGELQQDIEVLLIVKSSRAAYPALEAWLGRHHPHDVLEILAVPVTAGLDRYLDWLGQETTAE